MSSSKEGRTATVIIEQYLSPYDLSDAIHCMNMSLIEFKSFQWANLMLVNRACRTQVEVRAATYRCEAVIEYGIPGYQHREERKFIDWKGTKFQGNELKACDMCPTGFEAWCTKVKKLLKPGERHVGSSTYSNCKGKCRITPRIWPGIDKLQQLRYNLYYY